MTFRDDAVAALRAGQNAGLNDPNPYSETSPLLARIWMKGFETMLTIRTAATPARQAFLSGDAPTG